LRHPSLHSLQKEQFWYTPGYNLLVRTDLMFRNHGLRK
jgi:hypothetical protein